MTDDELCSRIESLNRDKIATVEAMDRLTEDLRAELTMLGQEQGECYAELNKRGKLIPTAPPASNEEPNA